MTCPPGFTSYYEYAKPKFKSAYLTHDARPTLQEVPYFWPDSSDPSGYTYEVSSGVFSTVELVTFAVSIDGNVVHSFPEIPTPESNPDISLVGVFIDGQLFPFSDYSVSWDGNIATISSAGNPPYDITFSTIAYAYSVSITADPPIEPYICDSYPDVYVLSSRNQYRFTSNDLSVTSFDPLDQTLYRDCVYTIDGQLVDLSYGISCPAVTDTYGREYCYQCPDVEPPPFGECPDGKVFNYLTQTCEDPIIPPDLTNDCFVRHCPDPGVIVCDSPIIIDPATTSSSVSFASYIDGTFVRPEYSIVPNPAPEPVNYGGYNPCLKEIVKQYFSPSSGWQYFYGNFHSFRSSVKVLYKVNTFFVPLSDESDFIEYIRSLYPGSVSSSSGLIDWNSSNRGVGDTIGNFYVVLTAATYSIMQWSSPRCSCDGADPLDDEIIWPDGSDLPSAPVSPPPPRNCRPTMTHFIAFFIKGQAILDYAIKKVPLPGVPPIGNAQPDPSYDEIQDLIELIASLITGEEPNPDVARGIFEKCLQLLAGLLGPKAREFVENVLKYISFSHYNIGCTSCSGQISLRRTPTDSLGGATWSVYCGDDSNSLLLTSTRFMYVFISDAITYDIPNWI